MSQQLHNDEIPTATTALRRAISGQHPKFAGLPLELTASHGTQNRIWRLGDDHLVRVPRQISTIPALEKEAEWLPRLGPKLPLPLPKVVAMGHADQHVALPWLITNWQTGADFASVGHTDLSATAAELAGFIKALQSLDVPPDAPKGSRGRPLAPQTDRFTAALLELSTDGFAQTDAVRNLWEKGLEAGDWVGDPVWLHGDLMPGNLLHDNNRLSGVIDWGCLSTGDPAYDLTPAWFLFQPADRNRFLEALGPSSAQIERARARVAWQAVVALPYYKDRNPPLLAQMKRGLAEVLRSQT
ncbi:MAG: phosphotransferase [Pseudomonadota bacterium]